MTLVAIVIEKIKANLKWEKHPRGGELGFSKKISTQQI